MLVFVKQLLLPYVVSLLLSAVIGSRLRSLNLSFCAEIDDSTLLKIARLCPNITELNLSNCWELRDEVPAALACLPNVPLLDSFSFVFVVVSCVHFLLWAFHESKICCSCNRWT